ncbi:hypothetical protein HanXRQr2_Chr16g0753791 [Helianthus annuus]|uniref:Uncharacterized protein n=1 Tax=Helianthus annuus TaxID=4232 RepID=A0A9K3DUC8_HELAN|nr:hypothetical protein HanXRQr2_Chr16g0753791 [Helianthus annuus]KAJ0821631.1 hypothetical protein HanPSC8_Chr16g0722511 [Helianthus annuus]
MLCLLAACFMVYILFRSQKRVSIDQCYSVLNIYEINSPSNCHIYMFGNLFLSVFLVSIYSIHRIKEL